MTVKRGEVWLVELDPVRGSEQAGVRPAVILQNDAITPVNLTVVAVPLTTNLRRAALPSCCVVSRGEGGLTGDSVALCHQVRALDKTRLRRRLGVLTQQTLHQIEDCLLFAFGL